METLKTKDNMATEINNQVENAVSSFFYYMWNAWSEDECKVVYGEMYRHFWEKWSQMTDKGVFGAAERFYAELTDHYREKLVEDHHIYFGPNRPDANSLTIRKSWYAVNAVLRRLRYRHGWMSTRTNITAMWTMTSGVCYARITWGPVPNTTIRR